MRNRTDEIKTQVIEKLIAMEEEESLAKFRASDFEAKARKRIGGISGRKGRSSLWRTVPAAAWVSLAAVMLAGTVILLILPKKAPGPDMAQMIADILVQSPPIRVPADHAPAETAPQNEVASPMGRKILSVLLGGSQNSESDRSLNRSSPPTSAQPKSRSLSLEETYKILIIDKAVERFLALISS